MTSPTIRTARDTIVQPSGLLQLEFLRTGSQLLRDALKNDANELSAMKQELALLEAARLHIHRKGTRCYYYARPENASQEKNISEDLERVHALARRDYLQKRIALIERNSGRLRTALDSFLHAQYENRIRSKFARYSEAGLDLSRILFTKEQNEWIDRPYSPNPFYKESLKYSTNHGVPVRSLSEANLGSFLESVGLPFRSDDLVEIHTEYGDQPFRSTYFADFKVPNLCGGITIHEHLGAMHIKDYPDNSLKRLNDYHNFTVYELSGRPVKHSEITWSFEYDLLTEKSLHALLRRMLLPNLYA
ncbi:MAG: hypothetical protein IJ109_00155 [Firmicutes bacterium]|nr:hypothetical protein [Bacillota bacterium]